VAGCVGPANAPDEPQIVLPVEDAAESVQVESFLGADEWAMNLTGKLSAGDAWMVVWQFRAPQDDGSASIQFHVDACGSPSEQVAGLVMRFQPVKIDSGGFWYLDPGILSDFEVLRTNHLPSDRSDIWFGGSSEPTWQAYMGALVAKQDLCFEASFSGSDPARFEGVAPQLLRGRSRMSVYPVNSPTPTLAPVVHDVELAGWTHVQRLPDCGLPIDPDANHLLYADVAFPNGYVGRAGVYMNGILPGPTPSESRWFGTMMGTTGPLSINVKSALPNECVVVVESDVPFAAFGAGTGYIDQIYDRVLPV
jgi:hypothetical protein